MECVICKHGQTRVGGTTVTLERGEVTLVFKRVPAEICQNCGERYVDSKTTALLLRQAEAAAEAGVHVEVREFAAA